MKAEAEFLFRPAAHNAVAPRVWTGALAHWLDRSIYGALLVLCVLVAMPYGTVEPWWEACFEFIVFALAALWVVEGWLSGAWRLSGLDLFWPLLALTAFAWLQTLPWGGVVETAGVSFRQTISADPYATRLFALKLLALGLAGLLLQRYVSSRRRLSWLLLVLLGVGVLSALFGLLRQTTQHETLGFALPFLRPGEGYAQFINRNHFAFLMELTLGLALGLMMSEQRERWPLRLAVLAPLWAGLILCNSRGGILSLLGQALFLALLVSNRQSRLREESAAGWWQRFSQARAARLGLTVCLALVLIVSIVWMGGDRLASRMETLPTEISADAVVRPTGLRVEVWRATWSLIRAHPLLGSGFGAYQTAIPAQHRASGAITPQEAHNDYLELLAGGGLFGAVLAAWFLSAVIRAARRRLRESSMAERSVCYGALTGLFGVAVHSLVDFGLHITINALVATALLALATRHATSQTKNHPCG